MLAYYEPTERKANLTMKVCMKNLTSVATHEADALAFECLLITYYVRNVGQGQSA